MALDDTLIPEEDMDDDSGVLVRPERRRRIDTPQPQVRARPRTFELSDDAEMQLKEFARSARPAQTSPEAQPKAEKPLGLMGTIKEGARGTLRMLGATADTMQGDAQEVVKAAQEQADAPKAPDLKRFYDHLDESRKALGENPSLWEGIKAVGSAAIDNPRGFGLMVAEQLPNSGVALGAAGAGALAGSFAGPVGAAVGGLAGLAFANVGLETGAKALEAAQDKEFTREEQSRVRREGLVKGGVITGIDAGTLGLTKFITGTTKRAVEAATVKTLSDNGVDVTNAAARKAAMETPEIAEAVKAAQETAKQGAETLGNRLARTGGVVALETIGEGAGEYLGELAATGKANALDAVIEGFAGLGTSIGEITAAAAMNRKALNRLLDTQEEAEKKAEEETKATGVEHEVIPHPTEPEKFAAVPKVRSVAGIELERDESGNLRPKQAVSTQADFNLANRPAFELTAEDKLRQRELERQREEALAKNPIVIADKIPTIAGRPASELPDSALEYTLNRGSEKAQQVARDEIERRKRIGMIRAPIIEKPSDTVKRIVATGAEKAQEKPQGAKVNRSILTPAQAPNAQPAAPMPRASSMSPASLQVVLPDNTSLPAQWDVVDADSVKATIREGKNQPRDRTRAASDIQIQGIANAPDYRRLADSPVMDVGAPTLSKDGLIVGGNGRFEGVSKAYDQGTAQNYLANLKADAAAKGIDPARLEGMKKPVLVRRITQPFDVRKLAIASNSGTGMQYSGLELARIDAERMQNLENLDITDSGDIALTTGNIANVRNALRGYNAEELGALVDKDGMISQEGIRRIRGAMLYQAYGNSPALERLVESTDNDLRNITGALVKAAGTVAKTKADMKAGTIPKELDITTELVGAVEALSKLRSQGMSVDEYLSQSGLFGEEINADTRAILRVLDANIRSQRKIADFIRTYYDSVSRIDTSTDDIFGTPKPTRPELIKNAKERITEKQPESQDLFNRPASGAGEKSAKQSPDNAGAKGGGEKDQQPNRPLIKNESSLQRDSSWIIRNKETGEVIMETFDKKKVNTLNTKKYEAVPIHDYLVEINKKAKEKKEVASEKAEEKAKPSVAVRGDTKPVPRGGRILANGIAEEIQKNGIAALVGQKITSAGRLAELAQIYRNPQYETFRIFFTKGNDIVQASGVTARLPGKSPMFPEGMGFRQGAQWLKSMMESSGADGYWMLHNHPSGNPTPSKQDVEATKHMATFLPGFKGHVIINSNMYAHISVGKQGTKEKVITKNFGEDTLLQASKPHEYIGKKIPDPKTLVEIGKSFQKEGWITLVGVSGLGGVRAIAEIPLKTFTTPALAKGALRRFARRTGSDSVFAYGTSADLEAGNADQLVRDGFLRDAVDQWGTPRVAKNRGKTFGLEPGKGGTEVRQTATVRSGKETLEKYGLNPKKKYKTREVAAALEARQRDKYGSITRNDRSDKSADAIAEWMAEEVRFEMQRPKKSGVGWYSEKFQRALDVLATEFPELSTDKTARDVLTALIAITSDGQKVVPNFAMAADLYGNFRNTGKFTTERGHARQASINKNIGVIQNMYDLYGPEGMRQYFMQEQPVSELKKIAKQSKIRFSTQYQAHINLPMAAVLLGPKLGAFYANLMGANGYLTMDRWWSRTFNRYRGNLLQRPTRQGLDRFKELMGNPSMSDDEVLSAVIGPRNSYKAKKYKDGTEIEKAANTLYKAAFENINDSPFNTSDRTFMLQAVSMAQEKLAQDGITMSVADIQAVLWYYEKRLYGELGARQTADVSYEEAARKVIEERASAGGPGGRTVPESGTDESLDDSGRVGEEDYDTISSEFSEDRSQGDESSFLLNQTAAPYNRAALRDRFEKITDSLIYNFQDRFKPLKDIQKRAGPVAEDEDAALAEERYSGIVRSRLDNFQDQMRDPLMKAIHDSGVAYEDVEKYLHALHAPSRNAAMKEINPTEDELKTQISTLEKQRDTLAKDADVMRFVQLRRELRQAEADIEDGIADESLARGLKSDIAQIRKNQNVKDYSESIDKLKGLRLVKPFKGDNTALSGMSDKEAADILAKADKDGTRAKLDKISGIIDTITQQTRQIYVDSGLEKADAINAWNQKYQHYVPLHRDEVAGNTMPKVGQGFNIRGKESKRATGSTKAVTDILAHVVAQHEAAIIRSEKARVDRALFQFASTHPDPSLWTLDNAPMLRTVDPVTGFVVERVDPTYKNRPEVLTLKIDGEEHTITFETQNQEAMRLAASMKNLSSQEMGEVTQMVGRFTRFLATMNTTANPVFTARNFLRDLQTAYVNLTDTAIANKKQEVFRDIPAAIKGMWALSRGKKNSQWAKFAQEFKAAGGQTGWMDHYKDIGTRADALRKELEVMKPGRLNTAKRTWKSWVDLVNDANNAVENGARLAAYVNARRSGLSEGKAAQLAKNLTVNFNARGAKSVELNAWYMFMNASIQGTARLIKAMNNRQVRKIVAGIVLSGFLMDVLARAMAGDDDEDGENDYDQLPEHTKAMNFIFMVDGQPVTVPMPYGYNFFASAGRKVSEMIFRENYSPVRSAADLASIFLDAFSPVGQAGSGLQFVAPTVADPFVQWAENKNFAGNPLRKDQSTFGPPKPEYQMGFKSTSAPGKWLAEALNTATGGNEVRPGFINVNPVFFDFTVSSIAGGAGRTYLQTVSGPAKALGDDEIKAREVPFLNIFVGARPEYQTERKYFEAVGEVELAQKELTTYREKGDAEMVKQIREEHRAALRMIEAAKLTKELLARLRKRDLALDKIDLPNKSELRRELEEQKREAMSRFNRKYREAINAEG